MFKIFKRMFGTPDIGIPIPGNTEHIDGVDDDDDLTTPTPGNSAHWERIVIERIAMAVLREQSRARHWKMIMFFIIFSYIMTAPFILKFYTEADQLSSHTALIKIEGQISQNNAANIDLIKRSLKSAFENKEAKGVILRINSPGGSPVQSDIINQEIVRLKTKYPGKKVIAVVTDMAASGGYYIAVAADEIYANKSSIVGSIGVLMNSFGFTEIMKEYGIERRLYTSGQHKSILDPYSKVSPAHEEHVQKILTNMHESFITRVREGTRRPPERIRTIIQRLILDGRTGAGNGSH